MSNTTKGMAAVVVILTGIAFLNSGIDTVLLGLRKGGLLLFQNAPLIVFAFLLSGLVQVIVKEDVIKRWLGQGSGLKGILLGGLAGALIPGGPYIFYPLTASFLVAGADIGTLISFIAAKNLWSLNRIPLEIALLGPTLTWMRFLITLVFPIAAGLLAQTFFSRLGDEMREEIKQRSGLEDV